MGGLHTINGCACQIALARALYLRWGREIGVDAKEAELYTVDQGRPGTTLGAARWRKDWAKVSSELTQDRRAWSASIRLVMSAQPAPGKCRHK